MAKKFTEQFTEVTLTNGDGESLVIRHVGDDPEYREISINGGEVWWFQPENGKQIAEAILKMSD